MTAPDARSTVHDHPFGFISIVLRGGYVEARKDPRDGLIHERRVWRVNFMRRSDAHTITALSRVPTWTLLFCGPNRRSWGFWQRTMERGVWTWTHHEHFDSGHYVP